jgi:hypothetical protein
MADRYLARGMYLEMGDGASTETFVRVAQVINHDGPSLDKEFAEFDDHDIPLGSPDFFPTKKVPGEHSLTMHYDPKNPTHIALEDEWQNNMSSTPTNWRFVFGPATAHARRTKAFAAYVKSITWQGNVADKMTWTVVLKLSGAVDLAAEA